MYLEGGNVHYVGMTSAADLSLTPNQFRYAQAIITTVGQRQLVKRVAVLAIETAITESGLQMYANGNNAESLKLPHDAVGWDHGSVGLFQQQVGGAPNSTANWGTTQELMDPRISCGKFLDALLRTDWQSPSNWVTCQNVQHSAYDGNPRPANHFSTEYGGNYHDQDGRAASIVNAIWGAVTPAAGPATPISPAGPKKFWVDTFQRASVFASPTSTVATGALYQGRNYVFGKRKGRRIETPQGFNTWWLKTDPDEGSGQWVSAYYLTHWGNDEAKDNNGAVLPDL